ncbi:MAG: YigZ family protein [Bacteroidota bacterium]
MPSRDFYYTIEKPAVAEFKDRGSKFIAYAFPVADISEFKSRLNEIKKEHPKATHHCFAYRIDENIFRVSDDGEPSGSAGKPILGQIDSKELRNVLIIVVRYFGGTQLGIPGLIYAYKTSAALSLQLTPLIQKPILHQYKLHFDYTLMNEVMRIIKIYNCAVTDQQMTLFCDMEIGIQQNNAEDCLTDLNAIYGLEVERMKAKE